MRLFVPEVEAKAGGKTTTTTTDGGGGEAVDCTPYEVPLDETGGCVENLVVTVPWYDEGASCECQ